MRLGHFSMPMHPMGRPWQKTLQEDRQAIILADKLGFYDAFIGEHLTDKCESITNSMIFLASVISETKNIKLGTGTSNLSHTHPVLLTANAAMMDHLSDGRMIIGVSAGALPSDAEALGILDEDRNEMFAESIDVIMRIWEGEAPYNIDLPNNRYKVSTERTANAELGLGSIPMPLQKPHPEIVGTVVAPYSKGVTMMGARDFHPLSANFLLSKWLKTHWPNYVNGKESVGAVANPDDWRIARTIFVADSEATAKNYGKDDSNSPYRFYYTQLGTKLKIGGRLNLFKSDQNMPDDSVTLEGILDDLVITGTVNNVVDQILALREEVGDFGELVYAGMDWVDPDLAKRSMQLMAEEVMPRVNAAIGKD